jgi:hypothetical protein
VEVLLREYDNLAAANTILLRGQHTLAVIGATLPLGVIVAAVQFDRPQVELVLPMAIVLIACIVGAHQTMMAYREVHLATVERAINERCGPSLLSWYSEKSDTHLARSAAPTALWLWLLWPMISLFYATAVVAGVVIVLSGSPGPDSVDWLRTEQWRIVGATAFALFHVVLAAWIAVIFFSHKRAVRRAYDGEHSGWIRDLLRSIFGCACNEARGKSTTRRGPATSL